MRHPLPRGRIDLVALLLAGSVAAAAILGITPDSTGGPPSLGVTPTARACPLTLPQEYRAGRAFEKMLPAVLHPRCLNCHGGVDPFKPADEGGHLGGAVGATNRTTQRGDCKDCHYGVPNLRNGRPVEWEVPVEAFHFVNRSRRELCNQFKELSQDDPVYFVRHVLNDNGGVQFTAAAYKGDRHLTRFGREIYKEATGREMVPEPPPIPHGRLVAHAKEWTDAIGKAGWKIPDCGCRLMGDAWEGTVTTVLSVRPEGLGTLTETMHATARFEIDSSFMTIPPGDSVSSDPWLVWKTTSGKLDWTVNATGGDCTTSASGSAPIGLGADANPWGSIWIEPDSSGDLTYSVQIGPWPEGYYPSYTYRCRREVPSQAGTPYGMHSWWVHPEGAKVSADGQPRWGRLGSTQKRGPPTSLGTIKDSLASSHPLGGTIKWVWDFKLVRRP